MLDKIQPNQQFIKCEYATDPIKRQITDCIKSESQL